MMLVRRKQRITDLAANPFFAVNEIDEFMEPFVDSLLVAIVEHGHILFLLLFLC